jgi:hypothetical protein
LCLADADAVVDRRQQFERVHRVFQPAEKAVAKSPEGAAQMQQFHRRDRYPSPFNGYAKFT